MSTGYSDKASYTPGPMGWGLSSQSVSEIQLTEARQYEQLVTESPLLCQEKPAKAVIDSPLWQKVKQLMAEDGIEDGFSFRYLEQAVFGDPLKWLAQIIGSCVGSGAMRAHLKRVLAEIFLFGQAEEFFGTDKPNVNSVKSLAMFAPWAYGMGRELGNFDNMSDGSYCGTQIKAMFLGNLPCWAAGLTEYCKEFPEPQSGNTYRLWGDRGYRSVRAKFKDIAAEFALTESVKVTASEDCKRLLIEHFKPMLQCSSWGFGPAKKIAGTDHWVYTRSGSWAHNMTRQGYVKINGNWYVDIQNSWGDDAHKDGDHFLVEQNEDERWLRESESQTIGELMMPESMPQV